MDSKRVDQSLFFAGNGGGGLWVDAVWSAAVTDDATGEVLATAINPELEHGGGRWSMVGVRLSREFLATLRELAGVDGPLPGERERAEAAYWRECAEYAMQILARGRSAGGDWAAAALNAESYLRQTLGTEVDGDGRCYDCRMLTERVAALEAAPSSAIANRQWETEIEKRLDHLENRATAHAVHVAQVPNAVKRINELDQLLQALIKDCVAIERRLEKLEQSKPQPLSAVEALRQIANIQAQDPDGLKMTWSEMALACIGIAKKALESA